MTKQWKKDTARWGAFGDRLRVVLNTAQQMQGMPGAVAADAVESVAYVVEPLRELEHVEVPEPVREAGRVWHAAAKALAAKPDREKVTTWLRAGRNLRGQFSLYDRRIATPPAPVPSRPAARRRG